MKGFLYLLTNSWAQPDLFGFGYAYDSIADTVQRLSQPEGVPGPYQCEWCVRVPDAPFIWRATIKVLSGHAWPDDCMMRRRRENPPTCGFFRMDKSLLLSHIQHAIHNFELEESEAYAGVVHESRLHAKWALFFNALNVRTLYVPSALDLAPDMGMQPVFILPDWQAFVVVTQEYNSRRLGELGLSLLRTIQKAGLHVKHGLFLRRKLDGTDRFDISTKDPLSFDDRTDLYLDGDISYELSSPWAAYKRHSWCVHGHLSFKEGVASFSRIDWRQDYSGGHPEWVSEHELGAFTDLAGRARAFRLAEVAFPPKYLRPRIFSDTHREYSAFDKGR